MSGFLYFVEAEAERPASIETLKAAGIYYAFEDGKWEGMPKVTFIRNLVGGPLDKKSGYFFGDQALLGKMQLGYFPLSQRWKKLPGRQTHVGVYRDALPTPDSLRRKQILPGYLIELEDGHKWEVPCARFFRDGDSEECLPTYLDIDDDGKWIGGEVLDRYQRISQIASEFWKLWEPAMNQAASSPEETVPVAYELTVEDAMYVLSRNYRLSGVECALLRLFSTSGESIALGILERLCDCPSAVDFMLKKKALDITSTTAGDAA